MQHPRSIQSLRSLAIHKQLASEASLRWLSPSLLPPTRTERSLNPSLRENSLHQLTHNASRVVVPVTIAAFNEQPFNTPKSPTKQRMQLSSSASALPSTVSPSPSRSHSSSSSSSHLPSQRQSSSSPPQPSSPSPSPSPSVLPRSTIKRRKEHSLDRVVDRNKKFVTVQRMIELLNQTVSARTKILNPNQATPAVHLPA